MNSYLETLETAWKATASQMSFHRADDSAKDWRFASTLKPLLKALEEQIKAYGGERPDGTQYLISWTDRIDWPVAHQPDRFCNDCGYITQEQDLTVCPDNRCRGAVG